jgi:hypothetical protein
MSADRCVAAFKRAHQKRALIRWEQLNVNPDPGLLLILTECGLTTQVDHEVPCLVVAPSTQVCGCHKYQCNNCCLERTIDRKGKVIAGHGPPLRLAHFSRPEGTHAAGKVGNRSLSTTVRHRPLRS